MSDSDQDEFLSKWDRGPITNSMRANVGKTDDEVQDGIQHRIRDARTERPGTHRMSHDGQRDLGYDDQRDLFKDAPGDYGWYWEDEGPQQLQT